MTRRLQHLVQQTECTAHSKEGSDAVEDWSVEWNLKEKKSELRHMSHSIPCPHHHSPSNLGVHLQTGPRQ